MRLRLNGCKRLTDRLALSVVAFQEKGFELLAPSWPIIQHSSQPFCNGVAALHYLQGSH